jgi:large subunit ribosomal protein L15
MNLTDARKAVIPRKKKTRVGRGESSGQGKTAGRGHKGQGQRAGVSQRRYFEGGQMPNIRRLPKFGFNNAVFKTRYEIVNVSSLNDLFNDGDTVDEAALRKLKIVSRSCDGVKILGNGTLEKKLTVKVEKFTKSAREKIEKAGGTVEVIGETEEKK